MCLLSPHTALLEHSTVQEGADVDCCAGQDPYSGLHEHCDMYNQADAVVQHAMVVDEAFAAAGNGHGPL